MFYCFARVKSIFKANEEAKAVYYTVIKHCGHLRTLDKCRIHSPAARVLYIFLVFSNDHRVLSQCNTWLRLLNLLNKNTSHGLNLDKVSCSKIIALTLFTLYKATLIQHVIISVFTQHLLDYVR